MLERRACSARLGEGCHRLDQSPLALHDEGEEGRTTISLERIERPAGGRNSTGIQTQRCGEQAQRLAGRMVSAVLAQTIVHGPIHMRAQPDTQLGATLVARSSMRHMRKGTQQDSIRIQQQASFDQALAYARTQVQRILAHDLG